MSAQAVDHTIKRFVRHRFKFVAAAPQNDDWFTTDHIIQKVLDEKALSDARRPVDIDGRRKATLHLGESALQDRQLAQTPDERAVDLVVCRTRRRTDRSEERR